MLSDIQMAEKFFCAENNQDSIHLSIAHNSHIKNLRKHQQCITGQL